ncbi:hypothetical protein F4861DRAFT_294806 [Xylaria intraflava]|nr:hypothetical protein F4861DRAFT_294806 [Xylaria intraflava]
MASPSALPERDHSTLELAMDEHQVRQGRYPEVVPPQPPDAYGYYHPSKTDQTALGAGEPSTSQKYSTLPEATGVNASSQSALVPADSKKATICGLRRKYFWFSVAAAILVVIGVVVGATVGTLNGRAAIAANKGGEGQDAGSGAGNDTVDGTGAGPAKLSLFENTRLASANFSDVYGNDNFLLVYQLNDGSICMSAFNSSNNKWVVSTIANATTYSIKLGTSLALDTNWQGLNSPDVNFYFQGGNPVTTIWSQLYSGELNLSTVSVTASDDWTHPNPVGQYNPLPDTSIVAYGKQCDNCNQYSYLFWQGPSGIAMTEFVGSESNSMEAIPIDAMPSANTSITLTYSGTLANNGGAIIRRSLDLFYRTTTSGLVQARLGNDSYISQYVGRDIGPKTQLAAFSTGFNESDSDNPTPLGFQVLSIDPDAANGVQLTYLKDSKWDVTNDAIDDLGDCVNKATMAVNRGRRLYCLVESAGNTGVEIMEWAWRGDPSDTNTYANWDRIGIVDIGV